MGVGGSAGVGGKVGVGGKDGSGVGVDRTVGVGAPVNGVAVGVPANGVGVAGVDVETTVGIPEGVGDVPGVEPPPTPGVDVVDRVPARVGVLSGAGVPGGGCVGKVANAATVGVGLKRPLGSEGVLAESHPPRKMARGSAVTRNGLSRRTGSAAARSAPRRPLRRPNPSDAPLTPPTKKRWCARPDSNRRPSDPESDALSS